MPVMNENSMQSHRIQDWQQILNDLFSKIRVWVSNRDCAVKLIDKTYEVNGSGRTTIPALLIQEEALKMIVDPIDWDPVKSESIVDLYIMPQYEDGARFFYGQNEWRLYWVDPEILYPRELQRTDGSTNLDSQNFNRLLDGLKQNAVSL